MNTVIHPGARAGTVCPPASKSSAHRSLICAALSGGNHTVFINGLSEDILVTAACLDKMTGGTVVKEGAVTVLPFKQKAGPCSLPCNESGTTLRLLLPLAGALGKEARFCMSGRLPCRPLEPLKSLLISRGMKIEQAEDKLFCSGRLTAGDYEIAGNVSSQYISGLLLALPLLCGESTLRVTGKVESAGYIALTEQYLRLSGIRFEKNGYEYRIHGGRQYAFPAEHTVAADWSGAAAFICAGALSDKGVTVKGMDMCSLQGDKRIIDLVKQAGAKVSVAGGKITVKRGSLHAINVNAADIPDLVPVLSALLAGCPGRSEITGAGRLRLKESDRLKEITRVLSYLGGDITETENGLVINGKSRLKGGTADPAGDHRIAMAAAVAAGYCEGPVTVTAAECVNKSYPAFWRDLEQLEVTQ